MSSKVLTTVFVLLGSLYIYSQDDLDVTVLAVQGQAQYKEPGADSSWKKLEAGVVLKKGYQIQTGLRAKALLRFSDATKIGVRSATFMEITEALKKDDAATGKINVDIGSLRIKVEKERKEKVDIKISTPHGTASVRGTDFMLNSYSDIGTGVVTFDGIVGITTPEAPYSEIDPFLPEINFDEVDHMSAMMEKALEYMQVTNDNFAEIHSELPPDLVQSINETTLAQIMQLEQSNIQQNLDAMLPTVVWAYNEGSLKWELFKSLVDPVSVSVTGSFPNFKMLDQFNNVMCTLTWDEINIAWALKCVDPGMPCEVTQSSSGSWIFKCSNR